MSANPNRVYQFAFLPDQPPGVLRGVWFANDPATPWRSLEVATNHPVFQGTSTGHLSPVVRDFMDIVAAVRAVDRLARRYPDRDGRGWHRRLAVSLAVRDLSFWAEDRVWRHLHRLLNYVTDD